MISCMDTADGPTVEEEDANAAKLHAVAPRFAIEDGRRLLLHLLPADHRPADRDHGRRVPDRSS